MKYTTWVSCVLFLSCFFFRSHCWCCCCNSFLFYFELSPFVSLLYMGMFCAYVRSPSLPLTLAHLTKSGWAKRLKLRLRLRLMQFIIIWPQQQQQRRRRRRRLQLNRRLVMNAAAAQRSRCRAKPCNSREQQKKWWRKEQEIKVKTCFAFSCALLLSSTCVQRVNSLLLLFISLGFVSCIWLWLFNRLSSSKHSGTRC